MFRSNLIKLLKSISLHRQTLNPQNLNSPILLKSTRKNVHLTCCKCITSKSHLFQLSKEEEYLVKVKDDPDRFGDGEDRKVSDPEDEKEDKFLETKSDTTRKLNTKQYADIIKEFIRNKKVKEAIDVLEVRMIEEDRVKPENYIYNLILGACGRVGYTKKAFALYNRMKQRGLKVTGGTYTALFNACANSPWPEDGLKRANHLRDIMIEKQYEPNDTNYNAMIKAFGRCGDLATAFQLVDEMAVRKVPVREDTLNFLLQSCVSDKDAGFRHALLVWRKFYERGLNPDIYSFNLLLKCTKECNLGDIEVTKDVIDNILKKEVCLEKSESQLLLDDPERNSSSNIVQIGSNKTPAINTKPNLISKNPHLGNIISLNEIKSAEDRFLLIGSLSGFLQTMSQNRCTPDIKTFTQMLDLIPSTLAAEKELIATMKRANVKPDPDFYNMLIKKRSMRFDYESAREVLETMRDARIRPNIVTYGVLALGCKTTDEAEAFMEEMKEDGHRMNAEILGAMLHQACYHCNFKYVLKIMDTCAAEEIRPNAKFMECLEEFKRKCRHFSNDKESNLGQSKQFLRGFQVFKMRYNTWKTEVDPINDDEAHPWQQFRQTSDTNTKHIKDKEKSSRFKPRYTSLYRQKKGEVIVSKSKTNKNKTEAIEYVEQKYVEGT